MTPTEARKLAEEARATAAMLVEWLGPTVSVQAFEHIKRLDACAAALDDLAAQVEATEERVIAAVREAMPWAYLAEERAGAREEAVIEEVTALIDPWGSDPTGTTAEARARVAARLGHATEKGDNE